MPRGEGGEYAACPSPLKEPCRSRRFEVGAALYRALGIAREDRAGRLAQYARNFEFFDAPVRLFVSIDRDVGALQWADLGGFVQTVMLLARADGLHSCAQEAWTFWHKTVSPFLGLPGAYILFLGFSDA